MQVRKSVIISVIAVCALLALVIGIVIWKKGTHEEAVTTSSNSTLVPLILLPNNTFGAKCLDGSPPGYYFRPGTGSGRQNWHIYLPSGGWCVTVAACAQRAHTRLGTTRGYPKQLNDSITFGGVLSSNERVNPLFHNWNLVRLLYCDGGGYAGTRGRINLTDLFSGPNTAGTLPKSVRVAPATNVSLEADGSTESTKSMGSPESTKSMGSTESTKSMGSTESNKSTGSNLTLRHHSAIYLDGWNIIQAVLQDLQLQRGFDSSTLEILLSGSSAGGQATANLCDWLASLFPSAFTRCLVDAGFFLDARDRFSRRTFRALAQNLTSLHRPVNPTCSYAAGRSEQWKCFFLQHTLFNISTPIFLFQAMIESYHKYRESRNVGCIEVGL
ncbi:unnamed protein product [Closterium sp. Yama58-4]|nr:unnamed protein product [Closterium sp. Yama58-4]